MNFAKLLYTVVYLLIAFVSNSYAASSDPTKLKTSYKCQTGGVALKHMNKIIEADAKGEVEVVYDDEEANPNLVIGDYEFLVRPQKMWATSEKSIIVMKIFNGELREQSETKMGGKEPVSQDFNFLFTEQGVEKHVKCLITLEIYE